MRFRPWLVVMLLAFVVCPVLGGTPAGAAAGTLDAETERLLAVSPYVYIATQRKDGTFGAPAEIWFMYERGAVWVASPTTAWRVKRIRAGRPLARIAVGARNGPTLTAKGSFVRDPADYGLLFATFAKKYPDGWSRYEAKFREGLKDGSRVLMRYQPTTDLAPTPAPAPSER